LSILVVGSVGLDDLQTPFGRRREVLGGAATYFSVAASLYGQVKLVGVVGTDFPQEHIEFLASRGVDLQGLQVVEGKTFRWAGRYDYDLNVAQTLDTQLNVFADFHPELPEEYRSAEFVFLANIDPELQIEVLRQVDTPKLTALDTMNYWIDHKKDVLTRAMSMVDVVLINEAEARQFARTFSLVRAARKILNQGPRAVVVKRGEYGAVLYVNGTGICSSCFFAPAYPLEKIEDPTGAGDSFAAGFVGYLSSSGDLTPEGFRRAVVHGSVVASFTVQGFSIDRLRTLTMNEIKKRYEDFKGFVAF